MTHPRVTVYSTSWCPDCHRLTAFLDERGVEFRKIDIEADPKAAALVMKHNDGKRRVPTLEIDGEFLGNPPLAEVARRFETKGTRPEHRSVVIVGTGPAGFTAAIYAARGDLEPLVLRGGEPGGQLMSTTEVENYPGFPEGVTGGGLMEVLEQQAVRFGAELRYGEVTDLDVSMRPFRLMVDDGTVVTTDSVILATGASARLLGLDNEKRLLGRGVSTCATCDGAFFRGRRVVVVGGGDTALEEALFLTRFATSVTIVHRRDTLRASKILQDRAFRHPKIELVWNAVVEDVLGDETVTAVQVRDIESRETRVLETDGVFIAIGHRPNTDLVRGMLDLDAHGVIVTDGKSTRTSRPGVFACGDVQDPVYRQAITAAGSGAAAAIDAERFLASVVVSEDEAVAA